MKNKLLHRILIILIVVGIVIASIIAVKAIMIKKVNSIKEITADQFKQKLSDKGYYISSSMNEQSPKYLKTAYTAISKDQTYDIKFYEAQTDEDALTNIFLKERNFLIYEKGKNTKP